MSELLELAERLLERAHENEAMEIYLSRGVDTSVRAYEGAVENVTSASSSSVGVRVLQNGPGGARVGAAWAGSLDEHALADAITQARENVAFASEDEFMSFASPDGVSPAALNVTNNAVATTPIDDKINLALDLERRVRLGDARVRKVESANYSDYLAEAAIISTSGIRASWSRSGAYVSTSVIAHDDERDHTGWGLSAGRAPEELDLARAASDAIDRATRMLGAVKPRTTKCAAVFDPRTTATLLAVLGGAASWDAVGRGRSFFAGRLGQVVASPLVTLVDDPTDPRHFAASSFDGEGLACRRTVLIERGELRGLVYDTHSARRAGTTSTGGALRAGAAGTPTAGCRALQLLAGEDDAASILRQVGEGVYVTSLMGIHSGVSPVSGDFSVGVTGLMIRGGQLAEPIREVTVASTLQRMLLDVTHVGSDLEWLPGNAAGQTLAIAELTVAGA